MGWFTRLLSTLDTDTESKLIKKFEIAIRSLGFLENGSALRA